MTDSKKRKTEAETGDKEPKTKDWGDVSNRDLEEEMTSEAAPAPAGALEHPSYEGIEDQLTEAEQRAQKNYDNWLRTQAEFDNFKQRAEKNLANAHKFGNEKLVLDLIPVLDGLDQGLEIKDFKEVHGEVLHQVREGMELTYKMLLDTLAKYGVEQVDPEGNAFDPNHHEAMSAQDDPDLAPNTVIKVFQKGYLLHGRLIRPARVIVSKA